MLMLFNPLDPLGSLNDSLQDANNKLVEIFQKIIIKPPRVSGSADLNGIYITSQNLANYLAYVTVMFTIIMGVLLFRKSARVGRALVILFVLAAGLPVWLQIVDMMTQSGTDTASWIASWYTPPKAKDTYSIPGVDNPLLRMAGLLLSLFAGGSLAAFIVSYDYLIITFKFWAPIAYSISSFGKRATQFSNMILSLGLVSTTFGRPFAVFFMEMGQIAVGTFPLGETAFGATVYILGSYAFAFLSQLVLFVACYKGIGAIEGKIAASIANTTQTVIKNIAKVDITKRSANNIAATQPIVGSTKSRPKEFVASTAKQTAAFEARKAASRLSTGAAIGATAAGFPVAGAVINSVGNTIKPKQSK